MVMKSMTIHQNAIDLRKNTLENFTYNISVKFIGASVSFKSNGEERKTFSWEIFSNDLFINPISEVAFP